MSLWRDSIVPALAPRVAYAYIRLLRATMRLEYQNHDVLERCGQYILVFWHSRFVMMPYVYSGRRMVVLGSRHRDSRMLGWILKRMSFELALGSSTSGGTQALREVLRKVKGGYDVTITPDGPRGPRRRVKPGVIATARMTGLPVVPVAYSARPARRIGSWDRTLIPFPFARGLYVCGEPLRVARDVDDDEQDRLRTLLESEMDRLTDRADTLVGLEPEEARPPGEA